jgi:hypothetical protein
MMTREMKAGVLAVGLLGMAGVFPVSAQLPSLSDKEVLGYFVAVDNKTFQFRLAADGKMSIKVLDSKGNPINNELAIPIVFTIEETLPGGKTISRKISPESLESAQPATLKPKDIAIKGKVTGDIGFEAFVSEERGSIVLGGHLLNPAELKNPTRFLIEVRIPNAVTEAKADEDKKAAKEREEKIKDDKLQIVWTDGKKTRIPGDKAVEGSSKEVTGPGITAASIEFGVFKERKIVVTAAPNSSMKLSNSGSRRLPEGFSLFWSADSAKDPQGKARVAIEVK